jgi:hypothetical protein
MKFIAHFVNEDNKSLKYVIAADKLNARAKWKEGFPYNVYAL